jgi:hypothetical protein
LLIVPHPTPSTASAGHLLSFIRSSTPSIIDELWRRVGNTVMERRVSHVDEDLYVSTAGMGVSWLHVRVDPRPKYYSYKPFKGDSKGSTEHRYGAHAPKK